VVCHVNFFLSKPNSGWHNNSFIQVGFIIGSDFYHLPIIVFSLVIFSSRLFSHTRKQKIHRHNLTTTTAARVFIIFFLKEAAMNRFVFLSLLLLLLVVLGSAQQQEDEQQQEHARNLRGAGSPKNVDEEEESFDGVNIPRHLQAGDMIPGSYIILFNDDVDDVRGVANAIIRRAQGQGANSARVSYVYETVKGFSVLNLPPGLAKQLEKESSIKLVEQDGVVSINAPKGGDGGVTIAASTPPPTAADSEKPWGVARVGGGVDGATISGRAFVIDTGIDLDRKCNTSTERALNHALVPR
jgi:Ca2+/Na+ antiporter